MFRRKEESTTDAPSAPASSAAAPSAPAVPEQHHDTSAATQGANQAAAGNTYVPTAPSSVARPAEPARAAIPPAAASYRPAPIAEFNRGAARSPNEAMRVSSPSSPIGSFGNSPEKSSSGKSNRRVLTVGNDILLKGEIATCDRLVIEGRVEAKLSDVHTVEIAEVGSFKGTAEVEDAEVSGVFEGDLIVRNRLVIYASGEVRGNISYGEIEIERGGRLTGQIKTGGTGAKKNSASASYEGDKARSGTPGKEATAAA